MIDVPENGLLKRCPVCLVKLIANQALISRRLYFMGLGPALDLYELGKSQINMINVVDRLN